MSDVEYGKMFFNVFNIGYKHVFKGFFLFSNRCFLQLWSLTQRCLKIKIIILSFIHTFIHPSILHSFFTVVRKRENQSAE